MIKPKKMRHPVTVGSLINLLQNFNLEKQLEEGSDFAHLDGNDLKSASFHLLDTPRNRQVFRLYGDLGYSRGLKDASPSFFSPTSETLYFLAENFDLLVSLGIPPQLLGDVAISINKTLKENNG